MGRALLVWALSALIACGGSQGGSNDAPRTDEAGPEAEAPEPPAMSEEERVLAAHQAREGEACDGMCARLTECAVADTQQHAPEELEGVNVEALAREHRDACASQCRASQLSVRQVETIEGCNEADAGCEEFVDCLDAVQPQPEPSEP